MVRAWPVCRCSIGKRDFAGFSRGGAIDQYSGYHLGDGKRFLAAACGAKAEGIISKRIDCPYKPGNRGLWVKTKCINEEEFVIVGYSEPKGSRPYLGALLLAYYDDDGRLIYAGRAGTGMSQAELKRVYDKLQLLRISEMPLDKPPPRSTRFGSPLVLSGQMGEAEARCAGQVSDVDGGWLIAASVVSGAQGGQAGEGCATSAVAPRTCGMN